MIKDILQCFNWWFPTNRQLSFNRHFNRGRSVVKNSLGFKKSSKELLKVTFVCCLCLMLYFIVASFTIWSLMESIRPWDYYKTLLPSSEISRTNQWIIVEQ